MSLPTLAASIAGIGFWSPGLPSWSHACAYLDDGSVAETAPARPAPQLLAANERRRAPETVAVALEVALAACTAAGRDPVHLSSVFASAHGDLAITDYMCATLASDPLSLSPTRFHNSVHNAAAGYWTIGAGAMAPATAISAHQATFAQGLLEAMAQLASGSEAVLLVGYDGAAHGPLAEVAPSTGLLGGALLLVAEPIAGATRLHVTLRERANDEDQPPGPLSRRCQGNAMRPMLPLFEALALSRPHATMHAGHDRVLAMELFHG